MIYIIKQEGLYQNKVNSSIVSTCNCKMGYSSDDTKAKFNNYCFLFIQTLIPSLKTS